MDRTPPAVPAWAGRIAPLMRELKTAPRAERQSARAQLWVTLHAALFAALRSQARRIAPVSHEDLEDLASGKALELLEQAEESRWDPGTRPDTEILGYVWRVARNALVDLARKRGREAPPPDETSAWDQAFEDHHRGEAGPLEMTSAHEFVQDLSDCLDSLAPRSRMAWSLRAMLERPSFEIAVRLGLKPAHVDVLVQRARQAITACMGGKGHKVGDVHPQAFVLWWTRWSDSGASGRPLRTDAPTDRARPSGDDAKVRHD